MEDNITWPEEFHYDLLLACPHILCGKMWKIQSHKTSLFPDLKDDLMMHNMNDQM